MPVASKGLPLATGAKHVEDTVGAGPVRDPGAALRPRDGYSPAGEGVEPVPPHRACPVLDTGASDTWKEPVVGLVGEAGAGAGWSRRLGFFRFRHSPSLAAPLPPSSFTTQRVSPVFRIGSKLDFVHSGCVGQRFYEAVKYGGREFFGCWVEQGICRKRLSRNHR